MTTVSTTPVWGADTKVVWGPQPGAQEAATACPVGELFFGGARGGGKTDYLIGDFAVHAQHHGKGARGLFIRRTITELADVEVRMHEIYGENGLGWTWKASTKEWITPQGGFLRLRYLDRDEDADKYQGWSLTWIGVDEVGNFPNPDPIDKLRGALRSVEGVPTYLRLTGNPGGVGHGWIRKRYVDPHPKGWVPFTYKPQPELNPAIEVEAVFIPAKLEDNPLLAKADPDYEKRLAATGGKALYRAWRFGDWDAIVGAAFTEWRSDVHVTPQGVGLLPGWRLAAGLDFGYRSYGAFLLCAFGPEEDCIVLDELYFRQQTASEVGQTIGRMCRSWGNVEFIVGDTQMWQAQGTGITIAEQVQKAIHQVYNNSPGFPVLVQERKVSVGDKKYRVAKKMLLHEYLKWSADSTGSIHPWGMPRLKIHPRCKNLIRTIPALPIDPRNGEDIDTTAEDHCYDALMALLMSRPPVGADWASTTKYQPGDKFPGWDYKRRRRQPRYMDDLRKKFEGEPEVWGVQRYEDDGLI